MTPSEYAKDVVDSLQMSDPILNNLLYVKIREAIEGAIKESQNYHEFYGSVSFNNCELCNRADNDWIHINPHRWKII